MVVIVSPDHELSKKDFISPEDLKGFELIMHEKISGSRETSDAYFKKYGIELNITGIYDNSETIKNLVKKYSCVSMMSITDVIEDAKNGSLVAIPFNPSMIREYCMVFHKIKYLNKPLEEFISIAEEWCSLYESIMSEKLKNGKIENYTGLNII